MTIPGLDHARPDPPSAVGPPCGHERCDCGPLPPAPAIDTHQQTCARAGCNAQRLSRPGTAGQAWRPCWKCRAPEAPVGEHTTAADGGP